MANHKSAKKRHRQSLKRNKRNHAVKSAVRTALKNTKAAVAAGDLEQANTLMKQAESTVAKAATKGVYHKNNAARKVSRLSKLIQRAKASA